MLQLVFPLDADASRTNFLAWQDLHARAHSHLNRILSGAEGAGFVLASRKINTTAPLAGGGTLASDLTLSILANGITNALLAQMPANTLKGNNTGALANAIDLTVAQILAMLGLFGGPYLSYASPAGTTANVNPGGGWPAVGRLDVTLAAGSATWRSLVAGTDGQSVLLANADATNTLTLNNQDALGAAANRFRYADTLALLPGMTALLIYYGGTVNRWVIR